MDATFMVFQRRGWDIHTINGPDQPRKAHPRRYVSGRMARTGTVGLILAAHHPVATRAARGMTGLPGLDGLGMSDSVTLAGLVRDT